jgi:DNA-binding GntR family transcriptional regulator
VVDSGEPAYARVAADIRAQIIDGRVAPGQRLPSEPDLARHYRVGVDTIRDALAILRNQGLVVTRQGYGTRVREERERVRVVVPRNLADGGPVEIGSRMPSEAEIEEWDIPPGVPVLTAGRLSWPADRFVLVWAD